jgi:penicillin-binding protein 1C
LKYNSIKYKHLIKKNKLLLFILGSVSFFSIFWYSLPRPLFDVTYSTVVESNDGRLLGARVAADQQWRFPLSDSIPLKYEKCVILFEDTYFYMHPGINPVSLIRAAIQNIKAGKIIRGGSTLTMQVCRLARNEKARSFKNKIIEMMWALNLEIRFSKKEILNLYASHAPFGGNVVGLDAAAWRYFARPASELSWAESASLAVLPNAPSLIYPGKLDQRLKQKRDRLLTKLLDNKIIDSLTFQLSVAEPLPEKVNPLPVNAYHLVEKAVLENNGERVRSTIDGFLQEKVNDLVWQHRKILIANHIYNLAVVVSEVSSKQVKAYVGNFYNGQEENHANKVDVVQAPRSTGSILKPFLYCKMLDDGIITPHMLIPDIPTRIGGFTPLNFDQEYNGAVPAAEALARSLNIPAVKMLQGYGVSPYYAFLKKAGMKSLTRPPDHYGLSLILGGAEISLWQLAGMYTSMVSIMKNYDLYDGYYAPVQFSQLNWNKKNIVPENLQHLSAQPEVRSSAIYLTLQALLEVKRPESEMGWQEFASMRNIAWKTGTSFGFRDGWAVGMTRDYVVAVWVGNADGEGRPGLTGISAAAPLMFDVFKLLPASEWFNMPVDEMEEVEICRASGYRPGLFCDSTKIVWLPSGTKSEVCSWHRTIHLNNKETHRVNADCYPVTEMKHKNWFVLPPAMEYYFRLRNPVYALLPPLMPHCNDLIENMEFVYPREWNNLFIPVDLDGTPGKLIFELVHRQQNTEVYWHLDEQFLGTTSGIHQIALRPEGGWHVLNVTDDGGNSLIRRFFVEGNNTSSGDK